MAEGTWVAGSIQARLKLDTTQFQKGAEAAAKGTAALSREAKTAHSAFSGMWKQMAGAIGVTSLVAKGIGFVRDQISDTIRVGREFEKQWANATTQMNLSAGAMEGMKRQLLSLSPTLGSATELAHGMYEIISAGIPAGKAIDFLAESAKAAKAGFTDTNTAIDALTTVINAYGLSADDATRVSDMMFESVKRGKQTYEEMAGALGTVVPIASQVGVGFDQVAAAMATLTRQGIDANTATVQLRQILVSVLNPSREAEKTAAALGIQFNTAALQAKGLGGFLEYVMEKTHGDSEALTQLFGNVRALTGVMALGGVQAQAFAGDLEGIRNSAGQTDLAFQKQMKTLDFWLTTAKNAFEKIKISFYEGFAGPIKEGITSSKQLELELRMLQERFEDFGRSVGKTFKFVIDNAGIFWAALKGPSEWAKSMAERLSGITAMKKEMLGARVAAEDWAAGLTNLNISQEELARNFGLNTEEGAKWRAEMERQNSELEAQKGNLTNLNGVMIYAAQHMRDQVSAIIETSTSSEQAASRIRELREFMKSGGEAAEEAGAKIGGLDEATKKYKEKIDQLLDSLGINEEKNKELIDTDRILHGLYESKRISLEKFNSAHKDLVNQMFEYGETVKTPITQTRTLGDIFNDVKGSAEGVYYGVEDLEDRFRYFAGELGVSTAQLLQFQYQLQRVAFFLQTGIMLPALDFSAWYKETEKATGEISNEFDNLWSDVAASFDNALHEIARSIAGLIDFKKLFGAINIEVEFDSSAFDAMIDAADKAYDQVMDTARKAFDQQELQISRAEEDEDRRYDRQYDRERKAIENSKMTREQKEKMLLALEIKYENEKLARDRAREDAKYKREEEQKKKLLLLEEEHERNLAKIRADEDAARQKLADDELKRQDSLWFKVKGIFATTFEEITTMFLTKLFEPIGTAIGKLAGKLVGKGADTLTGAFSEAGESAGLSFSGLSATIGTIATTIGTVITTLATTIATAIGTIAAGIGTALVTLATAIATAATILAAAIVPLMIIGAFAVALYAAFKLVGGAIDKLLGLGGGDSKASAWIHEARDFLADIRNDMSHVNPNLDYLKDKLLPEKLQGIRDAILEKVSGVFGAVNTSRVEICKRLDKIIQNTKEIGGAQAGAVLDRPQLVMTHGTPQEPEWILPESKLLKVAAGAGAAGPRQVNIVNTANLQGLVITDRDYMRTRLMPEFVSALYSTEFKGQVQKALGIA